ncbi:MAG: 6,7-dimethyl-8-ribityllumazine synthase [Gaiellales bacterium]
MSEGWVGQLQVPEGCSSVAVRDSGELDVAIVASRFNADVVQRLLDGAVDRLTELGVPRDRITVVTVPGAWELPLACRRLAEAGGHQAVITLGCVIRGDTPHFEYVCAEAARGITGASIDSGVPVSFGLLTCDTQEQAMDRAGGRAGNKGADAASAAVEMANTLRNLPRRR